MSKTPMITVCALLIVALAVPAIAGSSSCKEGSLDAVAHRVYKGGTAIAVDTEAHLTGCLRNVFGLFNPCLDLVKGCTDVVLAPVEKPFAFMARAVDKPKRAKRKAAQKIPVPQKPKIPEK